MPSAYFNDSRFRLDYSVIAGVQDVQNNRTNIRRVLTMVRVGSSYANSGAASSWHSNTPTLQSGTFTFNFGNYASLTLMDHWEWVTHNADGTMAFNSDALITADLPNGWDTATVAQNVYLNTIPRATTPTVSGGFTTGVSATINLPRASGAFTHDVSWKIGAKSGTVAAGASTSTTWTPAHHVMSEFPNAATGNVTITVVTKNGSTVIGSTSTSFLLTAGPSIVPTVSTVLWDDANATVKANIGAFVQGLSLIKGAVSAEGTHGSTITTRMVSVGGSQFPENQTFQIVSPGTVIASGEAVDSRGRSGTRAANFTVLAYEAPKLGVNDWKVQRANSSNVADDNGQYLRVDLHVLAKSLIVGSEKNSLTISIRTRPLNGGWTNRNSVSPGLTQNGAIQISGGAAFLGSSSYEIEITVSDKTGVSALVLRTVVTTTVVTVDLRGNQVGFGKMHERGTIDVAGDGYATAWRADDGFYVGSTILEPIGSGKIWFSASPPPAGWLLCQGQPVSRTTYAALFALMGTVFGAGNGSTTFNLPDLRGRVPAGMSSGDSEFDTIGKQFGTKTHTLTISEMPSHDHGPGPGASHVLSYGDGNGMTWGGGTALRTTTRTGATGAGGAHNNIQPTIAVNWLVRAL